MSIEKPVRIGVISTARIAREKVIPGFRTTPWLEVAAIAAYAFMGLHMRRFLAQARGQRIFNRSCAVLLASAGLGLLLSRRESA